MKQIESIKTKFSGVESIKEFVLENGWYIPSLHEKYLVKTENKNEDMNIFFKENQSNRELWKIRRENLERNMKILEH
ncbi:MAG: hypothetical protein V3R82_05590 [Candidatus Hydrothermarchaeales archaeon]